MKEKIELPLEQYDGLFALNAQVTIRSRSTVKAIHEPGCPLQITVKMKVYHAKKRRGSTRAAHFDPETEKLTWRDGTPCDVLNIDAVRTSITKALANL